MICRTWFLALLLAFLAPPATAARSYFGPKFCAQALTRLTNRYRTELAARPRYEAWEAAELDALATALAERALARRQGDQITIEGSAGPGLLEGLWQQAEAQLPPWAEFQREHQGFITRRCAFLQKAGVTERAQERAAADLWEMAIARVFKQQLVSLRAELGPRVELLQGTPLAGFSGKEQYLTAKALRLNEQLCEAQQKLSAYTTKYWDYVAQRTRKEKVAVDQPGFRRGASNWALTHLENAHSLCASRELTRFFNQDTELDFNERHLDAEDAGELKNFAVYLLSASEDDVPRVTKNYLRSHLRFLEETGLAPTSIFQDLVNSAAQLNLVKF